MNPKILDEISRKFIQALPEGMDKLPEELRKNLRSALTAALARVDLVTRDEFDVQSAVLARTREKLAVLEDTVKSLEQALLATDHEEDATQSH